MCDTYSQVEGNYRLALLGEHVKSLMDASKHHQVALLWLKEKSYLRLAGPKEGVCVLNSGKEEQEFGP